MNHPASRSFLAVAACAAGLLLLAARARAQTIVVRTRYAGYSYAPYQGAGDLIRAQGSYLRAQGDFLVKKEEAALLREDVLQKKLDTHHKQLEHWEWVRDFKAAPLPGGETIQREPARSDVRLRLAYGNL